MKINVITIAGNLGSGKSTTASGVANQMGWPKYSSGGFMRDLAIERGMTLNELSEIAEKDKEIDFLIDLRQKEFMQNHTNFVMDSRLGFYWAPTSFKVLLTVDFEIAAKRVFDDHMANRRTGEIAETLDQVKNNLIHRAESEQKRYLELYGIENYTDPKHFDLVIDTGLLSVEETVEKVIAEFQKWIVLP